jgi:alkylation response protein AidB-like acyl-CoA dehydrogenase
MATANASQDVLVGAARKLGPLLRENANQGERDRRLPAATVKGLTEAGFFRLCRPRELGGLEADPITVLNVVEEIARHDGSAAWCALNCSIASVLQSFLVQEGTRRSGRPTWWSTASLPRAAAPSRWRVGTRYGPIPRATATSVIGCSGGIV